MFLAKLVTSRNPNTNRSVSMNTYSFPILSYVYRLDHPDTGEFYIGYRYQNVKLGIPPELDIGITYPTSSKYVKYRVKEFDITIVAEFFKVTDAYDHEQLLIHESWGNPKMLNRVCFHGKKRFDMAGVTGTKHRITEPRSKEHNSKIGKSNRGKKRTDNQNKANAERNIGTKQSAETIAKRATANTGQKRTKEVCKNISESLKGRPHSPEHRAKNSAAHLGKKTGAHSAETITKMSSGMKGKNIGKKRTQDQNAAKSASMTGKRMFTDGITRKRFRPGTEPTGWVQIVLL